MGASGPAAPKGCLELLIQDVAKGVGHLEAGGILLAPAAAIGQDGAHHHHFAHPGLQGAWTFMDGWG